MSKEARWWNDKAIFAYHFARSNYITIAWNWFLMLAGKAAEPVLLFSVLYSGYKILPHVAQPAPSLDAIAFIAQMIALDIGGMGLMKLAQKENLGKGSLAYVVGLILVGLMIANVVLSTVERLFPALPADATITTEATLLIARAVMCVVYAYAIHSLRNDEEHEPTQIVKSSDVHSRLDEMTTQFQEQLQRIESQSHNSIAELARIEKSLQHRLNESSTILASNLQTQLAEVQENLQKYKDELAFLPDLQQIESSTNEIREEIRNLKTSLDNPVQTESGPQEKRNERPILHALPKVEKPKFDARSFVFDCLQENPDCKLADIEKLASLQGQELSQSSISRYRSQFFARNESSTMQA